MSKTGKKLYEGLIFDAINYLSMKLNFTYTVIMPETSQISKSWNTSQFAKLGEVRIFTKIFCHYFYQFSILFVENQRNDHVDHEESTIGNNRFGAPEESSFGCVRVDRERMWEYHVQLYRAYFRADIQLFNSETQPTV